MALPRPRSSSTQHPSSATSATLAAGTRVRGRLTGDGDVTVFGHLEGEVRLRGELTIGEGGHVVSDVEASALVVQGTLDGDINVSGDVSIAAGAKVSGDVHGASVSVDEGAEVDGRLDSAFTLPSELDPKGAEGARTSTARR